MNLLRCDHCGKIVKADKNHDMRLIKVYEPDDCGYELNCSQYFHLCKTCLRRLTKEMK